MPPIECLYFTRCLSQQADTIQDTHRPLNMDLSVLLNYTSCARNDIPLQPSDCSALGLPPPSIIAGPAGGLWLPVRSSPLRWQPSRAARRRRHCCWQPAAGPATGGGRCQGIVRRGEGVSQPALLGLLGDGRPFCQASGEAVAGPCEYKSMIYIYTYV